AQADAVKKVLDEEEGLNEEDVKVDIPTVKPMNAQPLQLQQQHLHLQQLQQYQEHQLRHQHLYRLHQQQHPQLQQGLPPFAFIPNMPMPQFNWNIPAIPNVFP